MFEGYDELLPPHWQKKEDGSGYINELTSEESDISPFQLFLDKKGAQKQEELQREEDEYYGSQPRSREGERDVGQTEMHNDKDTDHAHRSHQNSRGNQLNWDPESKWGEGGQEPIMANTIDTDALDHLDATAGDGKNSPQHQMQSLQQQAPPTGKFYDYFCQWNERNLDGKVSLFGLTIRYYSETGQTLVKFDGIVGEWLFSQLKGPYGSIEQLDLFIGAKVNVFGRHLSISAASAEAINWIERAKKRLEKQQRAYQEKIISVGKNPVVAVKTPGPVRHITRGVRPPGTCDLRRLALENARLGKQIADIGLAVHL